MLWRLLAWPAAELTVAGELPNRSENGVDKVGLDIRGEFPDLA